MRLTSKELIEAIKATKKPKPIEEWKEWYLERGWTIEEARVLLIGKTKRKKNGAN